MQINDSVNAIAHDVFTVLTHVRLLSTAYLVWACILQSSIFRSHISSVPIFEAPCIIRTVAKMVTKLVNCVQVAHGWASVRLQLVALRQKIQSIGRIASTRSYAHRREKVRMCRLRQALYSLRPSPETRPHSPGDTWRTQQYKTTRRRRCHR